MPANWVWGRLKGDQEPKLWLIDFEYGAIGDRFFDLANFSINSALQEKHDEEMLDCYFGAGKWGPEHMARVKLYKVVSDLRESLWSYVQWGVSTTCSQEFYEEYGVKCFDRFTAAAATPQFEAALAGVSDGCTATSGK